MCKIFSRTPSSIDIAKAVYGVGTFTFGKPPREFFINTLLPNGDLAQFNWQPGEDYHHRDVYRATPEGLVWISSDTVDPSSGEMIYSQRSTSDLVMAPRSLQNGQNVALTIKGTYQWGAYRDGVFIPTYEGTFTDTNYWSYRSGVLTRHEVYRDNDPLKPGDFDLTNTYDATGPLSIGGVTRV